MSMVIVKTLELKPAKGTRLQPTDDLKPSSEEVRGNELRKLNKVLNCNMESGAGGGNAAVVSVGKMIQEDKEEMGVEIEKKLEKDEEMGGCGGRQDAGKELEHSVLGGEKMAGNGIQENGNKGVSGNGSYEDMKVKCSGNGISLVVDVKGSLVSENGSEGDLFLEGHEGSLADEHEGNASGEPMEIDTKQENGESDSKMGLQEIGGESAVIGVEEKDQFDVEDDENEDHDFVVGDFVWAKIESHQWWPGQIYDPSDASDHTAKLKGKGQLLVVYFGDGLFSWCSPSQLKPFVDNFREMLEHSNSKSFVNAVRKALDEVGRVQEAELTCKCQAAGDRVKSSGVVNSGIKPGVPVPKGNTVKVLIDGMEPIELLSTLDFAATMESTPSMLELTVLRSFMTAFYSRKGGYLLPVYHEPKSIEGLDDKKRRGIVGNSDTNGPSESRRGRKKKSVAELLGEKMGVEYDRNQKIVEGAAVRRQRKKSKYLSPPYTSPMWRGKGSVESKSGSEEVSKRAAKQLENASPPVRRSSGKKSQLDEGSDSQEEDSKIVVNAALNVNDLLRELLCAAVDSSYLWEKKKDLTVMTEFISSFRSSVFEDRRRKRHREEKCTKTKNSRKAVPDEACELEFVKQKLEMLSSMVDSCEEGKMNVETKASLERGMKELLEKVSKMG